ncbi:protein required for attachment to host cells [Chromohalobacter marismortui]|uniref:Protein required for attachment to host cells n=1 Tax=Chromohalobacter marismortui TaxID=42055 RepID=A0A4R7NML2_9GAMM|nr:MULTISPECIES: host attachment protein [Chromohalobacter]MCI0509843.1 host attachment protein [Chromohalobacter sp.]MCI0591849.1 host attachment protein [Chromohalobacter sp.]TDU22065.1 protein required for attachment to host cells [Chromohalobacter marismortui]
MNKRYIVTANATRARIFAHQAGVVREVDTLIHPEGRLHTGDLRTGGKGEADDAASHSPRQSGNDEATMEKHAAFFAKEVADYLRQARTQGKADEFVIAAAPHFLGLLRQKLDKPTQECVIHTLDKDLSGASENELAEKFRPPLG